MLDIRLVENKTYANYVVISQVFSIDIVHQILISYNQAL